MKKVFFVTLMIAMLAIGAFSTGCRLVDRGSDDTPPVISGVAFSLLGKLVDPSIKPNIAAGIKANVSISNDDLKAFVYKVKDGKKEKVNDGVGFPLDPDGSYKCNFADEEGYYLIQIESSVKTNFFMSIVIGELTADNATQSDLEIDATTTAVALLVEEKGFTVKTKKEIDSFVDANQGTVDDNAKIISEAAKTDGTIAVTDITLNATASVNIGKTLTLTATIVPNIASNKNIGWSIVSGDTFIGLASTGVVTGKAEGKAVVKATAEGTAISSEIEIDVIRIAATGLTVQTPVSVSVGSNVVLSATPVPANSTDKVSWAIASGATLITLDKKTGKVTGKAVGQAVVTAKAGEISKDITINVSKDYKPVRKVTLKKSVDGALSTLVIRIKNVDAAFETTTTLSDVKDNIQTLVKDGDLTSDFGALTLKAKDVEYAEFFTSYKEFDSITFADDLPADALVEVYDMDSSEILTSN